EHVALADNLQIGIVDELENVASADSDGDEAWRLLEQRPQILPLTAQPQVLPSMLGALRFQSLLPLGHVPEDDRITDEFTVFVVDRRTCAFDHLLLIPHPTWGLDRDAVVLLAKIRQARGQLRRP